PRRGTRERRAPRPDPPSSACKCGTPRECGWSSGTGAGGSSATRGGSGRRIPRLADAAASRRRSTRGTGSPTRRSGGPASPSRAHERVLLAHPQRRACVVDEAPLVDQQRQRGGATIGRRRRGGQIVEAVPPQLRDAVERGGTAAALR